MAIKPITVSQLNDYISRIILTDPLLGNIKVTGEVSNLKYHSTGHVYFSIIDSFSKVNCFLSKEYASLMEFILEDGMNITLTGNVNIFKKNGTYSINVKEIEMVGKGNLSIAFEKLKEKLNKEGLFNQEHKLPIPAFPSIIGVITSETGAAVKDIIKTIENKNKIVDIIIFPVLVQGERAALDISNMIDFVNDNYYGIIDTLIVGRGGGSIDDLWSFNEEIVARSIYNSKIPIISGVGHEIDFTISDLVADLRAETPTAAANFAVYDEETLRIKLRQLKDILSEQLNGNYNLYQLKLQRLSEQLDNAINNKIDDYKSKIEQEKLLIEENNPKKILALGYSIIEDENKNVINSIGCVSPEKTYKLTLEDGELTIQMNIKNGCDDIE